MDPKSDLLQVALQWLGTRGLLGLFLAAFTTVLGALLASMRRGASSPLLRCGAVRHRLRRAWRVGSFSPFPEGSSMIGAILGLTARPLLESVMQLASSLRQDALFVPYGIGLEDARAHLSPRSRDLRLDHRDRPVLC